MSYATLPFGLRAYESVAAEWPEAGTHILASFNSDLIVLFQPMCPSVALFANAFQTFKNNTYKVNWCLRPCFLSAVYSSGWSTKRDGEHMVALTVPRATFEALLNESIKFQENHRPNPPARITWENAHDGFGEEIPRLDLGLVLRKEPLDRFLNSVLRIQDITWYVKRMRMYLLDSNIRFLMLPNETIYDPIDEKLREKLRLDKQVEMTFGEDEETKALLSGKEEPLRELPGNLGKMVDFDKIGTDFETFSAYDESGFTEDSYEEDESDENEILLTT